MGIGLRLVEDPIGIVGVLTIAFLDPETGAVVKRDEYQNLITDAGLAFLGDRLQDAFGSGGAVDGINYIALGTDNTPAAAGDVLLGAEDCRAAVFDRSAVIDTWDLALGTISAYWAAADADIDIEEVGAFAGSGATAAPDSGVLWARTIVSGYDNSGADYDVSIDWQFSFTRD